MAKGFDRRCSWLVVVLIALCCSLGSVWMYHRWFALRIVSVDFQGFSKAQTELVLQGKLDKEGIAKNFDAFQASYEALPSNVVPITNDVILGGKVETIKSY